MTADSKNVDELSSEDLSKGIIRLKRKISLLEGTAITIGAIIGSGIFISPKGIVGAVGSVGLSLIIWVASGLMSLISAICYAELGTSLPDSGGDYHYLFEAFGPIPAFLFMWTATIVIIPCNIAILGLSFAQYLIQPLFEKCQLPDESVRIIAAAAICILVLLNCWDVGASAKVTSVFTFSKLFALAVIITAGIFEIAKGNHDNFTESLFKYSKWDPGNITVAFFSGFFAYGGASTLNFVTEEIQNPSKTLPRAIFLSITTVIIAYVLANMAYFSVMSPQEILDSEAVAVSFGIRTLGSFSWVIPVFIVISTFGGLGVLIMQFSRLVFAGARSGHLPRVLSFVQIHRFTPAPALIFMGLISLIYLSTSDVYILITYGGFMYNFAGLGIASSIIYLRRVRPNLHRPIKVPLILPIISVIMSLCLVCLPIYTAPKEAAVGCGIMLTGLPVYYLLVLPSQNSNFIQSGLTNTISSATNVIQKLLVAVPEEMNFRSESNSLINRTN